VAAARRLADRRDLFLNAFAAWLDSWRMLATAAAICVDGRAPARAGLSTTVRLLRHASAALAIWSVAAACSATARVVVARRAASIDGLVTSLALLACSAAACRTETDSLLALCAP
jgi:hypothetical protein